MIIYISKGRLTTTEGSYDINETLEFETLSSIIECTVSYTFPDKPTKKIKHSLVDLDTDSGKNSKNRAESNNSTLEDSQRNLQAHTFSKRKCCLHAEEEMPTIGKNGYSRGWISRIKT
jgi:hypothetical protein